MPKRLHCNHVNLTESEFEDHLARATVSGKVETYNVVIAMVSARAVTAFLANQDGLAKAYKELRDDLATMSVPHRSELEEAILKAMRAKSGEPDGPR